uniref:Uncharacterized protein n=1 Tax=Lepeophtheirus salmonis TaxID=72036 RepID=A0A0K2T389_LEPSM
MKLRAEMLYPLILNYVSNHLSLTSRILPGDWIYLLKFQSLEHFFLKRCLDIPEERHMLVPEFHQNEEWVTLLNTDLYTRYDFHFNL